MTVSPLRIETRVRGAFPASLSRARRVTYTLALFIAVALILFAATSLAGADPAATGQPAAPTAPKSAAPSAPASVAPTNVVPPAAPSEEDSASYTSGFSDGCASSNLRYAHEEHVKPGRDANLYENDIAYHHGWDKGYRKCEDKVNPGGLSVPGNSVIL